MDAFCDWLCLLPITETNFKSKQIEPQITAYLVETLDVIPDLGHIPSEHRPRRTCPTLGIFFS